MSLDIYLYVTISVGAGPEDINLGDSFNMTHNLGAMAREAGIYDVLWRAPENGITHASQLVAPLTAGYKLLRSDPERFRAFNPTNGWGTYEGLVEVVGNLILACEKRPHAKVRTSR